MYVLYHITINSKSPLFFFYSIMLKILTSPSVCFLPSILLYLFHLTCSLPCNVSLYIFNHFYFITINFHLLSNNKLVSHNHSFLNNIFTDYIFQILHFNVHIMPNFLYQTFSFNSIHIYTYDQKQPKQYFTNIC